MSRNGGIIGSQRSILTSLSGIWDLTTQQQERGNGVWVGDGLSASTAAPSAVYLRDVLGVTTTGTYWITINGTARQVYCDMTNDGGGWMLYSSFGTGNPLSSGAISGNRLNINTLSANGWTTGTSDGSTYYYIDGTNNNTGYFVNEADNTSWFAFFASNTPPYGFLYLNTFSVSTPAVSQMRIRFGDPTNNGSLNNELYTNGILRVTNTSKVQNNVVAYTPTTSAGVNSMYFRELSICGISWIYIR